MLIPLLAALVLAAAARGLPITKLALYEPPFIVDPIHHHPPADHHEQLIALIAADRRGDAVKYYLTRVMGMPTLMVYVLRMAPMWANMKAIANSLPYDSAIMGDFSLPTTLLASLAQPALGGAGGWNDTAAGTRAPARRAKSQRIRPGTCTGLDGVLCAAAERYGACGHGITGRAAVASTARCVRPSDSVMPRRWEIHR